MALLAEASRATRCRPRVPARWRTETKRPAGIAWTAGTEKQGRVAEASMRAIPDASPVGDGFDGSTGMASGQGTPPPAAKNLPDLGLRNLTSALSI
jgi:hypothetical protein